jgi:hypothetical protein
LNHFIGVRFSKVFHKSSTEDISLKISLTRFRKLFIDNSIKERIVTKIARSENEDCFKKISLAKKIYTQIRIITNKSLGSSSTIINQKVTGF